MMLKILVLMVVQPTKSHKPKEKEHTHTHTYGHSALSFRNYNSYLYFLKIRTFFDQ